MKKIPVTILAYAGVLVAMNILLSRVFTINLGNSIRINFSAAPIFLAGIWFGPFIGGLAGIAADLMGCVVSGYAPFPLITVSTCLGVLFLSRLPVTVVTLLSNAFVVDLFVRRVRIRSVGASRSNGQSF